MEFLVAPDKSGDDVIITIDLRMTPEEAKNMMLTLNQEIHRQKHPDRQRHQDLQERLKSMLRGIDDPEEALAACMDVIMFLDEEPTGDPYKGRYV